MKRTAILLIVVLFLMVEVLLGFVDINLSKKPARSEERNNSDQVTIEPKDDTPPVVILDYSLEEAAYEFRVTNMTLKNLSSKDIRKIETTWYLVNEQRDGTIEILQKGLPAQQIFPNGLNAGGEAKLKFTNIHIRRTLLGRDQIIGNNKIKLAITNVFFTDSKKWKKDSLMRKI